MAAPPRPDQIPVDRLAAGADEAEYFEIAADPNEIEIIHPEVGAFADMPGERIESAPPDEGFYTNLAELLDEQQRNGIALQLCRLIEVDRMARKPRDEAYAEGIRRTGVGRDAPGGADFEGATKVVHPMLIEAAIDFQSRIMKELFPPSGPVKPNILGVPTKRKTNKAARVTDHMNFQITKQIKGARSTLEVLFAQVPLGGSGFVRQYWDHRLKRPAWQFASVDKVLVPYHAADFHSATRKTFIDIVDRVEFHARVNSGQYLDLGELGRPVMIDEPTRTEQAKERVQGVEDPGMGEDEDRPIYEVMAYVDISKGMAECFAKSGDGDAEEEGDLCPFLISIDVTTKRMLAMYRAWEKGDPAREPIDHLYEFPFIPFEGAYAMGFPQVIGGLSQAATGALRALLDSAHINNVPAGLMIKGSGTGGQNVMPDPGQLLEIAVGTESDDIRKRVMPMPFNPPSPVLFQLLGFLIDAAKGVVRTTIDDNPQNSQTPVPVGTQMSRVEEGLTVFSAIHGRAHAAMDRLLQGLHRLNRLYLPDEIKVDAKGKEILVRREDYEGPCDVQPASHPTIYSEMQRFNQLMFIQQRMALTNVPGAPPLYKPYEVEMWGLRLMKIPDPETLLNVVEEPTEQNAVNENLLVMLGTPIAVFPEQEHLAHLQVHLDFMKSQFLGMNQLVAPACMPGLLKHCLEHVSYFCSQTVEREVVNAGQAPISAFRSDNPKLKAEFDKTLALASQVALPKIEAALNGVLPVLMQAMQLFKSTQPPPPMDPSQAAVQAAQAETARKTQADQMGHQIDQARLQQEGQIAQAKLQSDGASKAADAAATTQKAQTDASSDLAKNQLAAEQNAIKAQQVQQQADIAAANNQTKIQTTLIDADTAQQISEDRLASGGSGSGLKDGESLSKT